MLAETAKKLLLTMMTAGMSVSQIAAALSTRRATSDAQTPWMKRSRNTTQTQGSASSSPAV